MNASDQNRSVSVERFSTIKPMVIGSYSSEKTRYSKIVTKNSPKTARRRLISDRNTFRRLPIDKNDTYQKALSDVIECLGVPKEHEKDFVRAIAVLAAEARSSNPHLLPVVLSYAPGARPGTVVTETTPDLGIARDFPKIAPEKWIPRGNEPPEDFAVRVYGKWMRPDAPHLSIGMPEIFRLDEPLYYALRRSPRNEKPEGFFLPSKKERNDAEVELRAKKLLPAPEGYNERKRLEVLARRRKAKTLPNDLENF